ncbi:MAG: MBL fold metallo-hydrolase [Pirellulales bacterium]|nr:MBL fold metallo-hydrolase [Pirellulales bacterium]
MQITLVVDDLPDARRPDLAAEHGLAFWIERGGRAVLFDTGQSVLLAGNAFRLGLPLHQAEAVVISHGHYDHTGGLAEVLRDGCSARIFMHPAALEPKYACDRDGSSREIGIPYTARQAVQNHRDRLVLTEQPTPVFDGLTATGPVPRATDFEDTGGPFFLDAACRRPDPLFDDQAVFFESAQGTVVLLGCAHAGVVNTLRYIRQLTADRPIHAVLGGMHLLNASAERLRKTIEEFRNLEIKMLCPAHCTGRTATEILKRALPDQCLLCPVGARFEFDL